MTIVVDWDVKPQMKTKQKTVFAESLREILRRKNDVCANLREILRESSCLRIFVRGVNAKKELFSVIYVYVLCLYRMLCFIIVLLLFLLLFCIEGHMLDKLRSFCSLNMSSSENKDFIVIIIISL